MDVEEPRRVSRPEEPAARDVISAESFVGRLLNARVSLSVNMLCKSGCGSGWQSQFELPTFGTELMLK